MNNYIETIFKLSPATPQGVTGDMLSIDDAQDVLSSTLADIGYESFEKDGDEMKAYISARLFDENELNRTIDEYPLGELVKIEILANYEIEGRDWNSEWERNYFKPYVFGDNKCVVHSSFHTGFPQCDYDIVIDPKMAFGTGHHSTTRLMVEALFDSEIAGRRVLDVGTGSAILAILASKLKAAEITAIEIDEAAYVNALENIALNQCGNIHVIHGVITDLAPEERFDIVLANINRNIILNDIHNYSTHLTDDGIIYVSGFYEQDIELIEAEAMKAGLKMFRHRTDNNWAALGFKKIG